jgi:hypothetical protein
MNDIFEMEDWERDMLWWNIVQEQLKLAKNLRTTRQIDHGGCVYSFSFMG